VFGACTTCTTLRIADETKRYSKEKKKMVASGEKLVASGENLVAVFFTGGPPLKIPSPGMFSSYRPLEVWGVVIAFSVVAIT
jgi:hypothetical protein